MTFIEKRLGSLGLANIVSLVKYFRVILEAGPLSEVPLGAPIWHDLAENACWA
jgi:hypothetical protein